MGMEPEFFFFLNWMEPELGGRWTFRSGTGGEQAARFVQVEEYVNRPRQHLYRKLARYPKLD
jgi:hypothetical protein